jgi:hypothetical protein
MTGGDNWRPTVSYTMNLQRIQRQLLGSDAAWERLSKLQPARVREMYLMTVRGPLYPWYWSAAVLAALVGLSIWILHLRIRSLDRLK